MTLTLAEIRDDLLRATGGLPMRLEQYGYKVYSQSDEDGIIAEIFGRIGVKDRTFVEFGVEVGMECNSRYLLEQGWRGVWIEGAPAYYPAIYAQYDAEIASGQLKVHPVYVSPDNINGLISDAGLSGEIDLLSIDIDSNDYHVWKAIHVVRPRVVIIEHNSSYTPPAEYVMPYNPNYRWDGSDSHYGSSLSSNCKLAEHLGYTLVGCGLYSPNGFFVRNDLLDDKFAGPFTAEHFFNPLVYAKIVDYPVGAVPISHRVAGAVLDEESAT